MTRPESIAGVINVDTEGLVGMFTQHDDLVLLDSRTVSDRNEGYIEGSINLPDIDTNCASLATAAPSLTTPLMFYCNGIRGGHSANAAASVSTYHPFDANPLTGPEVKPAIK